MTTTLSTPEDVNHLLTGARVLALDLETTGLNPRKDRVRLLSLHDGRKGVVLDCFQHDLRQFLPALSSKTLLIHNALFDLSFLWNRGLRDLPETVDTYLLAQILTAGQDGNRFGPCSLAACVKRHLGRDLPKELQQSDWSGTLSTEQIEYALRDVEVLPPLLLAMGAEIEKANLTTTSQIELEALPAWVWLSQSGVQFDRESWLGLAERARQSRSKLTDQLVSQAPSKAGVNLFGNEAEHWNWNSPQQVAEVLSQLGFEVQTTRDAQLALIPDCPFADTLREYRHQAQLLKMYGVNWLTNSTIEDGRLYPAWRQLGAASGRTSCEKPNCQQIPRDPGYRGCFVAPPGRTMVKADYGTLQMRIACNQSRDEALYRVFVAQAEGGPDAHIATAMQTLGKTQSQITKDERQIAKSQNFGLLFGMSAEGLRIYAKMTYGVEFTQEEAKQHRDAWLKLYFGVATSHRRAYNDHAKESRSGSGRRRLLFDNTPSTVRLNTPVQADESDGAKRALAVLWQTRYMHPDARPVLFNHDEIVLECPAEQAPEVARWLKTAMIEAMQPILGPVPCEVEVKNVPTWEG